MKLLRLITLALIACSPVLYVFGGCFLLVAFAFCAGSIIAVLRNWGTPDVLSFLIAVFVIPMVIAFAVGIPWYFLDGKFAIQKRLDDWIDYCLKKR